MTVAFDVDGTLVDTRWHVTEAYRRAGVELPDDAWHRSWEEWLPALVGDEARMIHSRKNREYRYLLDEKPLRILPAGEIVKSGALRDTPVFALSAGSEQAIRAALLNADIHVPLLGTALDIAQKNFLLGSIAQCGVYVDDFAFPLTAPGWCTIRYTDQMAEELTEELWMRLSSLRDKVSD